MLGVTSLGVVAQWGATGPQLLQTIANGIGYSPELNGVILLVKTPYTERTSWFRLQLPRLPSFQWHLKIEKLMYGLLGLRKTDFCEKTFLIKWWWDQFTHVCIQLNNTRGIAPPGVMPLRGGYVAFQGSFISHAHTSNIASYRKGVLQGSKLTLL